MSDSWSKSKWQYVTGKYEEVGIKVCTLDNDNMFEMLRTLEQYFSSKTRNGYSLIAHGSCNKAPQGIWWDVSIFFEEEEQQNQLIAMLDGRNLIHLAEREKVL